MTFEEFRNSMVPMTKSQYDSVYGEGILGDDVQRVLVYADCAVIIDELNGNFNAIYDNRSSNGGLAIVERELWDNFAKYELNPKKTIDIGRMSSAIAEADGVFWAEIAKHYPEIKHGDVSPAEYLALQNAQITATEAWIKANRDED